MRDAAELIRVLEAAREQLTAPDNDYAASSWPDAAAADHELSGFIARLQQGAGVDRADLAVLFAPDGPMRQVALSSGWPEAFAGLGVDFDRASARFSWDD